MNVVQVLGSIYVVFGMALIGASFFFKDERFAFLGLCAGGVGISVLGVALLVW